MADDKIVEERFMELTKKHVKILREIWTNTFPENICERNLCKLEQHFEDFFKDIAKESIDKANDMQKTIANLQAEAEKLQKLLKMDVTLPKFSDETPLFVIQSETDRSLSELREALRQRRDEICELLLEQEELCEELGEMPRPLPEDPLPTEADLSAFRLYLQELTQERRRRMDRMLEIRSDIKSLLKKLQLTVTTEKEDYLLNQRQVNLTSKFLEDLSAMKKNYEALYDEMCDKIEAMRYKLEIIWDRLSASPSTRNRFKNCTQDNQLSFDLLYEELHRCEQIVRDNIKKYVKKIRSEIVQLWDEMLISEVERKRFIHFTSDCYTEDLLKLHELELQNLQQFYDANEKIFKLFKERKKFWERMNALELNTCDHARYNNRGGQLLKEEKERKMIASKLPKIEQHIKELVQVYEDREHKPFTVYGTNIIEYMEEEWERKRIEREQKSSARRNLNTPCPLSKSNLANTLRTPLSARNVSRLLPPTAELRKAPSCTSLNTNMPPTSFKRKLPVSEIHSPAAKRPASKLQSTAKRSLLYSLHSPRVVTKRAKGKKIHVIATPARRSHGRLSGGKARFLPNNKKASHPSASREQAQFAVNVDPPSDEYGTEKEDSYAIFENRIDQDARSSVLYPNSSPASCSPRSKRKLDIVANENQRLAMLPKPRIVNTPCKQNCKGDSSLSTRTVHSPIQIHANRKLTTKNLPIII